MRWYLVSTPQSPTHLTIASPWSLITLLSLLQVCCETNCGDIDKLNSEPELMRMMIALILKHLGVSLQISTVPIILNPQRDMIWTASWPRLAAIMCQRTSHHIFRACK